LTHVVSPSSGIEVVGSLLVGSKVGYLPGSPGLVGRIQLHPKLSCAGEGVGGQKGDGGQTVKVWLVMGRQALAALRWASSSRKMYLGMSGVPL
jgi:hypothetical protein